MRTAALSTVVMLFLTACGDTSPTTTVTTVTTAVTTTTEVPGPTAVTTSTTSLPGTTMTVATTTTTLPATTTTALVTPDRPKVPVIVPSEVSATLIRYDESGAAMPFGDGEVEAHWYTWDAFYVVVFAGWDAGEGEPQCPGSSLGIGDDSNSCPTRRRPRGAATPRTCTPTSSPSTTTEGRASAAAW